MLGPFVTGVKASFLAVINDGCACAEIRAARRLCRGGDGVRVRACVRMDVSLVHVHTLSGRVIQCGRCGALRGCPRDG